MTDLLYWGGPVTPSQARKVIWERPTAILSYGRDGSSANAQLYRDLSAADGFAWRAMARKAGLDPDELGSLGIAGFSAFHGFGDAMLKNPTDRDRVCYVHLADACFQGRLDTTPKRGYVEFAKLAADLNHGKLLVATTNGPWGANIHYCYDYGPPKGNVCYDLTSGARCMSFVWDSVMAELGLTDADVWEPMPPGDVPAPTRAMAIGNFLWFHYESPDTSDPHGFHANVIATPYMQHFGAPWMASLTYPGMPSQPSPDIVGLKSRSGTRTVIAVAAGAAATLAAYVAWRRLRRT